MTSANDLAVRRALELAGVEFIDENGGGPGLRLRKRLSANGLRLDPGADLISFRKGRDSLSGR